MPEVLAAKKPARSFVLRLIEIERSLKNRKLSLNDERFFAPALLATRLSATWERTSRIYFA